jgi:AcrR family transcriptional regulator
MTSRAIQDAFVLLLLEREYEKVSMRHIAAVAGVGLGTLYLYFPGKDSIAAVTVHSRLRGLAAIVEQAGVVSGPRTLEETVHALARALVGTLLGQAAQWRALFVLERRISSPAAYRELYMQFVHLFRDAFASASDWPAEFDRERVALNAFSMVDAMAKHALLVQESCPGADQVVEDVECAVNGYFLLEREKVRSRADAPALASGR